MRFTVALPPEHRNTLQDRLGRELRAAMEKWVVTLEGAVQRWPTQWYTFYDFWPQPSGPA